MSGGDFEMICLHEGSIDLLQRTAGNIRDDLPIIFGNIPATPRRGYKRELDNFKFVSIYYTGTVHLEIICFHEGSIDLLQQTAGSSSGTISR